MKNCLLEITFSGYEDYRDIRQHIGKCLKDVLPQTHSLLEVAVNEAVNNAIKHSVINGKRAIVRLQVKVLRNSFLVIRVKDQGSGFAAREFLRQLRDPDSPALRNEALEESGRGILIMSRVTDVIRYNRRGNEVLLAKRLQKRHIH